MVRDRRLDVEGGAGRTPAGAGDAGDGEGAAGAAPGRGPGGRGHARAPGARPDVETDRGKRAAGTTTSGAGQRKAGPDPAPLSVPLLSSRWKLLAAPALLSPTGYPLPPVRYPRGFRFPSRGSHSSVQRMVAS